MCLIPDGWQPQCEWKCPKCDKVIFVPPQADVKNWEMCNDCLIVKKAEKEAYIKQLSLENTKISIRTGLMRKPHFKYNWKTGKAELIKQ